ncbi:MAG: tetratricopeptide repeat protein [Acidobacteria bacterium]|nr:tetratricopeptide repeat protein [Solirubrobacteraceae bacterium]MBU6336300.1 tetratricopeptide repeat protein [Acidobacteriota bacterium]
MAESNAYEDYRSGSQLLESGDNHAAIVALERARDFDPGKASVREALGRAYFGAQRYRDAATEFQAAVDISPVNDYALFCLGRSLQKLGQHSEACQPLAIAACMRPDRGDYVAYRDAARRLAA